MTILEAVPNFSVEAAVGRNS